MKRAGRLFEAIIAPENLVLAANKAIRGKRNRPDAQDFFRNLNLSIQSLHRGLAANTYPIGNYRQFIVHDPKKRLITAPCFTERVLHHAIMNVCEPFFEKFLIHDSYACRRNKGRIAAILQSVRYSRRFPYFLHLDVRNYFASIDHSVLIRRLNRRFKDEDLLWLWQQILDSYETSPGIGLPIGSLTSQHLANFYLGWFDRFVKESLHVKGFVRYMDDSVLWGGSRQQLCDWMTSCRRFLSDELCLDLKEDFQLGSVRMGFDFLGARVNPTHLQLGRRSRARFRKKMRLLEASFHDQEMDETELQARATSLLAFTTAGGTKSWKFRRHVLENLPVNDHWA